MGRSPTFADGTVFVANEFPGTAAIRPDGTGDVTDSHVLWEADVARPTVQPAGDRPIPDGAGFVRHADLL